MSQELAPRIWSDMTRVALQLAVRGLVLGRAAHARCRALQAAPSAVGAAGAAGLCACATPQLMQKPTRSARHASAKLDCTFNL